MNARCFTRWMVIWMVLLLAQPMWLWTAVPTPELPKEITAKVTGASKKQALALKEVTSKTGRSSGKSASAKSPSGNHGGASSRAESGKAT